VLGLSKGEIMSIRKVLALLSALFGLAFLVACGSGSPKPTPPPSGSFSDADLNGTYTFSTVGTDSSGSLIAIAGSFSANGSGGITGGAFDLNDPAIGIFSDQAISSSNYSVSVDGRGQATLNTSSGQVGLAFVLASDAHGLITEFDNTGSGSGTLDLQSSPTLAGPYTFSFSGIDVAGNPRSMVGTFAVDGSGTITSGTADVNDAGIPAPNQSLSGTVTLGSGTTPGTATLVTSSSGTSHYDVYAIDSTHLKFIEIESGSPPVVIGDAFAQQTTIPSGQIVFTAAGLDASGNPMALGGFMTSDGVSAITNGLEDFNDAGTVSSSQLSFSGSFTPVTGGRSLFTLNSFFNGTTNSYTFAAYPSSGGIQLLEIDSSGITTGAAYAQSSTSFSTPEGYGFNVSASNSGGYEEDDIAEFQPSGGNLCTGTCLIDVNDEGSTSYGNRITGSYADDGTGSGRGAISTTYVNGLYYTIDGSSLLFLETDNNQVGLGSLGLQTPSSAGSMLKLSHFARVRPKGSARVAWKHKAEK